MSEQYLDQQAAIDVNPQISMERIQNATPEDIHGAFNHFTDLYVDRKSRIGQEWHDESQKLGLDDVDPNDYDAQDAIDEKIDATELGAEQRKNEVDNRASHSAYKLYEDWLQAPEAERGSYHRYVQNRARNFTGEPGSNEAIELLEANRWVRDHYQDSLRGYYESQSNPIVLGYEAPQQEESTEKEKLAQEERAGQILEDMHTLETVRTKAEVYMPMDQEAKQQIMLTKVEHYSPQMAPGTEVYTVPDFMKPVIDGSKVAIKEESYDITQRHISDFYMRKTHEIPGWDKQLIGLTSEFLLTAHGKELVESLGITSLDMLTPEQAVKLSISFVQAVSKYTLDSAGRPDGKRADGMSAVDLLREGIDRKDDPEWEGNGVCRNVAANVKLVFDALKENQVEQSMLRNTYTTMDTGYNGDGTYVQARREVEEMDGGHAWNSFITIGKDGSANVTTVDATWALEEDASTALEHMDYTVFRSVGLVSELAVQSKNPDAVGFLAVYFNKMVKDARKEYGYSAQQTKDLEQFAFTKYMEFVGKHPEVIQPDRYDLVPDDVVRRALGSLKSELSDSEREILTNMLDAGMIEYDGTRTRAA